MPQNKHKSYPFPDWLQWTIEKNAGKIPVWKFPPISKIEEAIYFAPLTFQNRFDFLELFEKDKDEWVDRRFKKPKSIYEYVCLIRIMMPYSFKRGGMDWLVYDEKECIGILHGFEFSKETGGFSNRRCSIGYAFGEKVRGSGIPQKVLRHFQNYLFTKMNRLYLTASVDLKNVRSIRFLEGLGYSEYPPELEWEPAEERIEPKNVQLELFRSVRTKNKVTTYRKESAEEYRTWRSSWIKQPDGSYKIPTRD